MPGGILSSEYLDVRNIVLVHRVISRRHTVGFKRVWMRGVSVRSISAAIRNERTTTQTDPFQANPLGRGQLADVQGASDERIPHFGAAQRSGKEQI
jgi:hypothetical protein